MSEPLYLWQTSKRGRRVHIQNPETGRTFCQVENNGGKPLDGRGAGIPAGRRLCQNCADLEGRDEAKFQEPSLAVLMGERIADAEPELAYEGGGKYAVGGAFRDSGVVVPEPWKRGKQVRGQKTKIARCDNEIGRSKGRKPKRSGVKYAMPFNDDLPSW